MELSGIHMIVGGVCTVIGVTIPVIAYAVSGSKNYGKLEAVVTQARSDISANTGDIDRLGAKVDTNKENSFDEFVHKKDCELINKNWRTFTDGLMDRRDIFNEQNATDHGAIVKTLEAYIEDSKIERKIVGDKLDTISKCLISIQKKKDCD